MIFKIKKQDFNRLKDTHPDLHVMINSVVPNLNDEEKGAIAGLCIEYVIQSKGNVDVFQDDIDIEEEDEALLEDEF